MIQLMRFRGHQQNMRSKTCRQRIASQAFRHREPAKENRAMTVNGTAAVRMFPPARPLSRTPVASTKHQHQQTSGGRPLSGPVATAPLAIHNHKAIFGWAANLFLAAATSQTTTAEEKWAIQAWTPYLAGVTLRGTAGCAAPAPATRCPHPTSHRAWPVVPSLVCPAPAPANNARPLQTVFIYLHHPPLPA